MTRKPRKIDEHLVSGKLLCHAYGNMGEIATAAGFFAYFTVMGVYGIPYANIFKLVSTQAYNPQNNVEYNTPYIFNPYAIGHISPWGTQFYQNCNSYPSVAGFPNWLSTQNCAYDLRAAYLNCNQDTGFFTLNVQFPNVCYNSHS